MKKAEKRIEDLTAFQKELKTHWSADENVAVIEIDASKTDPGSYRGNDAQADRVR